MKYAIIEISGKQVFIEEGKYYLIKRLPQKIGSTLLLNRIILCNDNGDRILGFPYIETVNVLATVLEHCSASKIVVFKMKSKKKMALTKGYRQAQTCIMIDKIATKSAETNAKNIWLSDNIKLEINL